jgi:hypothetical protein
VNTDEKIWRRALLPTTATIQDAIRNLDQVAIKIVLVAAESGALEGTISDGDIRRGLLRGLDLNSPITTVIHRNAFVVPPAMGRETVMQLMVANKIQQIPVVDEQHHVIGLHLWDEINAPQARPNLMVIMAGGKGTRLRPHTGNCPKPMLPGARQAHAGTYHQARHGRRLQPLCPGGALPRPHDRRALRRPASA